jgi:linoleoyl-CoA desaturase
LLLGWLGSTPEDGDLNVQSRSPTAKPSSQPTADDKVTVSAPSGEVVPQAPAASTRRPPGRSGKLRFENDTGFHRELKRRVDGYFRTTGLPERGGVAIFSKAAIILLWFVASYLLLVFVASAWWSAALFSISLALSVVGIGFSIQHDANHGAFSNHQWINRVMGSTLDGVGGSSYVWRWKHNIFHHTYTNVNGADDDINVGPIARLSPAQRRRRLHSLQQFYLWVVYGFLLAKWHFVDDFMNVSVGRIARNPFPRPRDWGLMKMIGGKLVFGAWAFLIPFLFHRWWAVLLFYGTTSFFVAVVVAVVFQLAHCAESTAFPSVPTDHDRLPEPWAVHQVQTTVDFAQKNRFLTWYLGGLNFQIEHHLFPRICHVHYPQLASIVKDVCTQYGVRYTAHPGLFAALSSHWRFLRRMGRITTAQTS